MFADPAILIIAFSLLVILSYAYSAFAARTRVPSVLLLILTGIVARQVIINSGDGLPDLTAFLSILGTIGLVLIVLEGSLELRLKRNKLGLIARSFFSALVILLASSFAIAAGIRLFFPSFEFSICLANAIPMAVISSAIAIPSVGHLKESRKEFIIYESVFSDILGILFFNIMVSGEHIDSVSLAWMFGDFLLVAAASVALSGVILIFISKTTMNIKFFLMMAILVLLYTLGEMFHMSSLLLILFFGIILNNLDLIKQDRLEKFISVSKIRDGIGNFKVITAESAFLIRTFFFFIFGLTLHIFKILDLYILITGILIVIILYSIRYLYLKFITRTNLFPELFIAPRGLVTILLFYSIPESHSIGIISEGVLFFVIIVSSLLMMAGMTKTDRKFPEMEIYIGDKRKGILKDTGIHLSENKEDKT